MPATVYLSEKLERFSPKLVGLMNDTAVKLVKSQGEFVWPHHDLEDESFFGIDNSFEMHFRGRAVPHGVEHKPGAESEGSIRLIGSASMLNTVNLTIERTLRDLETL